MKNSLPIKIITHPLFPFFLTFFSFLALPFFFQFFSCTFGSRLVPLNDVKTKELSFLFARINPIFKKDDESDIGNYRPLSMLSEILESCVTDFVVDHAFTRNQLLTEYQRAYHKGHPTDLLLAHLTETWRRALDSNLVVGVLFIDFQRAFDSISHKILIHKLEHNYGIKVESIRVGRRLFEQKKTIHRCKWRTF